MAVELDHQTPMPDPIGCNRSCKGPLRLILTLTGLLLIAATVVAQDAPSPSPHPVNPICDWAYQRAEGMLSSPMPTAADATADHSPGLSVWHGGASLDEAIRMCADLDDFLGAAALHPEILGSIDPLSVVMERCSDAGAALDPYATCVSLVHALATPSPSPTPSPTPAPTPRPIPRPGATEKPTRTARSTPRPLRTPAPRAVVKPRTQMARVPNSSAAVKGATRVHYFPVTGSNPNQVIRSEVARAARYCRSHRASACVETRLRFRVRDSFNPFTGSCFITSAKPALVTVAHMPRWAAPRRVPAAWVWWWKKDIARTGWHEAQHIQIAKRYMADFPRTVVGRPCSRYARMYGRWARTLDRAQDAFDRRDYPRGDEASSRWIREASSRFPVYREGQRLYWD